MRKRRYWLLAAQAAVMCAAAAVSCVAPYLLYDLLTPKSILLLSGILQWALVPLCGGVSAYYLTRHHINRYLNWILPPACYAALPWLLIGYAPGAGVMLTCAFVSIVGAAAGEVKNRMDGQSNEI